MIDLKFAIQNVGVGDAENVSVTVETNPKGVMLLGVGTGTDLKRTHPSFPQIAVGKYETITYRYFVNIEFTDTHLKFTIKTSERVGKYGFTEEKSVPINTVLKEAGYIRQVKVDTDAFGGEVTIKDIPDFDVDIDIPKTSMSNRDAVAVVIGNRDYVFPTVPGVAYAVQDAVAMKTFLTKTLGYKEGNILFFENATQGIFNTLFGTKQEHKGMLFDMVKPNVSDVFIYYSGHGAPDVTSKRGYFVPVDCDPKRITLNGYSLNQFYHNLSQIPAKSFTVVIDACFSGISHGGSLLGEISPIVPVVENPMMRLPNAIVMSAARGDEVSGWYPEKGHGLFTYFFLKGISGDADVDKNKEITLGELQTYLLDRTEGVPYWARRLHGKEQHPEVIGQTDKVLVKY